MVKTSSLNTNDDNDGSDNNILLDISYISHIFSLNIFTLVMPHTGYTPFSFGHSLSALEGFGQECSSVHRGCLGHLVCR